jgi:hypothetical protein
MQPLLHPAGPSTSGGVSSCRLVRDLSRSRSNGAGVPSLSFRMLWRVSSRPIRTRSKPPGFIRPCQPALADRPPAQQRLVSARSRPRFWRHRIRPAVHHRPNAHHDGGSGVIGGEPFILDHSASCASLSCCFLSASRLSCSFDHQAAHVSPIMNAGTSPFSSSRWRELLLLITRSPHHSFM